MNIDPGGLPFADSVPARVRRGFACARPIFDATQVEYGVDRLAVRLTVAWQDRDPVVAAVLPDGLVLAGMLLRRMVFPLQLCNVWVCEDEAVDHIGVAALELKGRAILFVHGQTDARRAAALSAWATESGAAEAAHVALVSIRDQPMPLEDTAFSTADHLMCGSGLSFAGYGANLPGIYALDLDEETRA